MFKGKSLFGLLIAGLLCAGAVSTLASDEARLLRFPAIYGNQVVFSYAGDLYTVSSDGGVARRLTSDVGYEIFPKFSPDGKTLAFTGQYDGNTEVYIMSAAGGEPKRISWTPTLGRDDVSDRMGPNNIVMGWKDNDHVIFRSRGLEFNDWKGRLLVAPTDGGMADQLPFSRGAWCSMSPDGKKIAYNRVFREFRTWKRYRGGQADDVWVYDFETGKTENITNNNAQDIMPMWHGNSIYFISDREHNGVKRFNLYVYNCESKETKRLTDFADFDIKYPSLGDDAIVFENGGYIYKVDLKSADLSAERVPVVIAEDRSTRRAKVSNVSDRIASGDVSPDGKRALFVARGDVFTVPAKNGETRNLTATPGVHERDAVWSPDGKWIAYISDASGEDEIWIQAQDGKSAARMVTEGSLACYKYAPQWAPDSKKIAWSDRAQKLYYVELGEDGENAPKCKEIVTVAHCSKWEISDFSWSPDSQWLAWSQEESDTMSRIYAYNLASKEAQPVTDSWFLSNQPTWSRDGKYLYFASARTFRPTTGETEFNYSYFDMEKIYLVPLTKQVESPFKPLSDEVAVTKAETDSSEKKDEKAQSPKVEIDFDGIFDRVIELPIASGSYYGLESLDNRLLYVRRTSKGENSFCSFDFKERKENVLGKVDAYSVAAGGSKILLKQGGTWAIEDIPSAKVGLQNNLNLSGMTVVLDRQAEWHQIYNECWRQMRDFMYDPNLHGVDWKALHDRYEPLVDYVNVRQDLTYIIGELIGELNIGHAYVGDGDYVRPQRVQVGLLGADIVRDPASGTYQIKKIYRGQNWVANARSPLTEIGVQAKEGDYILAINDKPTTSINNIYEALNNTAGHQVRLQIGATPSWDASHEVTVIPVADEQPLRYYNWVENNIQKVSKATADRVGYIHIPDMGPEGMNQFVKHFYPQLTKDALIIDVRGNGGGNISPQITERLLRMPVMVKIVRNTTPGWEPSALHYGPKVCLADEFSASDGDIFSYRFKYYKLGPLVGKRTWGGVVGIRGSLPLLDGGTLRKPEFSRYNMEGDTWIMEGYGVDPDIRVDNDPADEYLGNDSQLDRAILEAIKALQTNSPKMPQAPAYPNKK